MSSRQEQNLDELLKNLRAVAQTEDDAPSPVEKKRSPKPMSDEDLQNRLKSLYQGDRAEEQNGDEDRYTLDEDFLKEAADYAAAQPMSVYERAETEVQPIEADVAVLSESEPLVIGAEDDETIEETDELEKIEERLDMYNRLAKKYGATEQEMLDYLRSAKVEELEVSEEPEEDEPLELLDDPQEETEESLASQSEDESFSDEAPFSEEEQKAAVLLSETLSEEDEPVWEQEEQRNASISVQTQAEAPEERVAGGRTLVQLFAEDAEVSSSDISVDDVDVVLSLSQSELDGSETEEEAEPEESQWFAEHVTEGTDDDVPWDDTVSETEITNAVRERTEEKSVSPGGIDFEPLAEEELVELPDEESAERLSEAMDDDTLNLLLQLDCKDELTASMGEERLQKRIAEQYEEDIPLDMRSIQAEEASDIKTSEVRLEQIRGAYRRRRSGLSWRLAGTVLLTLFLGLLEIPPLFGVEYGGILDYGEYPVVYVLFGLQLFLLCLAVSWKQLWESLKKTFFWKPNRYSHTVLSAIVVLVYDLFLIVTSKMLLEKPTVFHFAVSCILLVAVLSEWMLNEREYRSFKLFFSGRKKYTLTSVRGQGSLAEQMAAAEGGEAPSVFVPTGVSSPKGFFRMIAEKDTYKLYYSGFVALGLSAVLCCLGIYVVRRSRPLFVCCRLALGWPIAPSCFGLRFVWKSVIVPWAEAKALHPMQAAVSFC